MLNAHLKLDEGKCARARKKKENYVFNEVRGQNILKIIIKEKILFRRTYLVLVVLQFFISL